MSITVNLLRKRAEHNNGEISTLEEISLHQENLERIDLLNSTCRQLRILYLQSNLIAKIENVNRLKSLEYLNLALNNVSRIEGLEGCESLLKLDLTANFVADLISVEVLRSNPLFRELYLTGNPCTKYDGYRAFVVQALPALQMLDGVEVTRLERIEASQQAEELRTSIKRQQTECMAELAQQEQEEAEAVAAAKKSRSSATNDADADDDEAFWKEPTSYTQTGRIETHRKLQEKREQEQNKTPNDDTQNKFTTSICASDPPLMRDGRILQRNEARYTFAFAEENTTQRQTNETLFDRLVFTVQLPRFLDTSLVDLDVQPFYLRMVVKGKLLQVLLPHEVHPDQSSAQRSSITGELKLTLPLVNPHKIISAQSVKLDRNAKSVITESALAKEKEPSTGFVDNPEVPPLE